MERIDVQQLNSYVGLQLVGKRDTLEFITYILIDCSRVPVVILFIIVFLTQNRLLKTLTMTEFGYFGQFSCVQVQTNKVRKINFLLYKKKYSCRRLCSG